MDFYSAKDTRAIDSLEEIRKTVRQAKAMTAFNAMRERAAMNDFLTEEEIETEIEAARAG